MTDLRTNFRLPVVVLVLLLFGLLTFAQVLLAQEKDPYEVERLSRKPQTIVPLPVPLYDKQQTPFDKDFFIETMALDRRPVKSPYTGPANKPKAGLQGGDDIGSAIPIGPALPISTTGTTTGYNDDYNEGLASTSPDVVYSLTPTTDIVVDISLCLSDDYDTKVFIYENSYTPGAPYAGNDDACGLDGYRSQILGLPMTTGNTYYIVIDGYGGDFGDYVMEIDAGTLVAPCGVTCPVGATIEAEPCGQDPDVVNGGCNSVPEVYGSIDEGEEICGLLYANGFIRDLDWYEHTFTADSSVELTATADLPFNLVIWSAGCPVGTPIASSSGLACETVTISADLFAGDYIFLIGPQSFDGAFCSNDWKYVMSYTGDDYTGPLPPANNNCVDAEAIGEVTSQPFSTELATASGQGTYITSPDIFYCYTATCDGLATISLCGSAYDTKIAVYDGCSCPVGTALATNDDACGLQSEVTVGVSNGNQYLIQVGGYSSNSGTGVLSVDIVCGGVTNDDCADAIVITNGITPFDNIGATTDGDQHTECGFGTFGADVWFSYTATCTGNLFFSTCGSGFDTKIAVYDGTACPAGTLIGCNDDDCGLQSSLVVPVVSGNDYLLRVGGYNSAQGSGEISLDCIVPPPNDNCEDVTPVVLTPGVQVSFNGDNYGATHQCDAFPGNHTWEAFIVEDTCMQVTLDYCTTSPAFQNAWLNLATGCPCDEFSTAGDYTFIPCLDGNVTITWSSLTPGTYYYPVLSEELSVGPYTINVLGEVTECTYCDAASEICDEYIARVELGDIDNSSDCGFYEDYTDLSTMLWKGVDYDLSVTNGNGYSSDICIVWIDWNHDFDFNDPDEEIFMTNSPGTGESPPYSAIINPPAGAVVGPTTMRVRIDWLYDPTPCGPGDGYGYGEVEDYTVVIGEFVCGDANENDVPAEIADLVVLQDFYFNASGSWPDPLFEIDVNCDGCIGLADIVYLADFIHRGGDDLCCVPW